MGPDMAAAHLGVAMDIRFIEPPGLDGTGGGYPGADFLRCLTFGPGEKILVGDGWDLNVDIDAVQ